MALGSNRDYKSHHNKVSLILKAHRTVMAYYIKQDDIPKKLASKYAYNIVKRKTDTFLRELIKEYEI